MIASVVPFSGVKTNTLSYTEWCIVCELLHKSHYRFEDCHQTLSEGEILNANIWLSRKRGK